MASTPVTILNLPTQEFLNETFDFSVTFDNTGSSEGYGPFFDLVVPRGITLGSASFLGASVSLVAYTRTAAGWVDGSGVALTEHPYGSFALPTGTVGDKWYLVELPFGSFVGDQPPAEIVFANNTLSKANGAQAGTGLSLSSRGGFRYGNDALDNGEIVQQGGTTTQTLTPKVLELTKTADVLESETATGENFARTYTLTVNIANGETLDNLQVRDVLPNNLVYVPGTLSVSGATATIVEQPTAGSPQNAPNNDFVINLGAVTGTTSASDVVIAYQAYAPEFDANNTSVIDAASGNDRTAVNESQVTGTYGGVAVSKGTTDVVGTADDPADYELQLKSIAIQKDVAVVGGGIAKAGAVLEYTLTFQISDYFSFQDLAINDIFSDGQRFDSRFAPQLTINGNNGTTGTTTFGNFSGDVNGTFTSDNLAGTVATGTNGATTLNFNVSQRLIDSAVDSDGILVGDLVDGIKQSGTTATLVYRTVIQDEFTKLHTNPGYTGDASVDVADLLTNDVTINGKVVGSNQLEEDTSSADIQIPEPTASKSIYAIDGNTSFTNPRISPGQTVTYRLTVNAPIADIERLQLTDYLPLPIFEAEELTGSIGAFSGVPTAGTLTLGPNHTLNTIVPGVTPTFTTDNTKNTIAIDFGSFDDPQNRSVTIEVLFTVTATDAAFADGLKLTNQALVDYGNTDNAFVAAVTEIVQVELLQPELNITKGVVSTDATTKTFDKAVGPVTFATAGTTGAAFTRKITSARLAATPVDANLTGVDAGDLVRFALVVENTGGSGAFDAAIKDVLPTGLSNVQNLRVTDGAGNLLTYTGDLFGATGLILNDDADGALDKGRIGTTAATSGKNIIVITYDATVDSTVTPKQTLTSGAQILQFAGTEGGTNHTANATNEDWANEASTTATIPKLTLNLVGTEISNSTNSKTQAVIGELVEYELVLTVPEGTTPNSTLVNTLPTGLSLANVTGLTVSPGLSSSTVTNLSSLASNITVSGSSFTVNLGTLTNSNSSNATPETITLRFQAVVSNISGNQNNKAFNHVASNVKFNWNNGSAQSVTATEADNVSNKVTVVEPDVSIVKDVVVNGSGNLGDAGDPFEYTISISHAANNPDAFDLTFKDVLNSKIATGATITSVTDSAGTLNASNFEIVGGTLQLKSGVDVDLVGSRTIAIKVAGNLSAAVTPNETIDSPAKITWSSLNGTVTNRSIIPSVTDDDERTGTGGVNNYTKSDGAPIKVENVEPIKSIVSTSETATNNKTLDASGRIISDEVAIGEIVRYRLVTRLSEGQIGNLQIKDNLPTGLKFLNGTAKVGLVNTTTNNLSTSDSGLNGAIVANTNPDTFTPSFTFPDANVSKNANNNNDTYLSGTDIFFKLGNITNTGTNSGSEYVVIEFDALVLDEAGNTAAKTLTNNFDVNIGRATVNTSSDVTVTVVSPELSITQTLSVNGGTTGDAGDIVTVTLTVANTGTADAYEVRLENGLDPTKFDLANATSKNLLEGFIFDKSNLEKIVYSGGAIAKNTTGTFTFTVPLKTAVNAGETLVSQAKITEATSIEGTPTSGVERDIANPDILAEDKELTIARPIATKLLTNTSINNDPNTTVTVGEILTYTVTVTVPEGTTADLQLLDTLDPGLAFVEVVSIAPSSSNVTTSAGSFAAGMGTMSDASSADIDKGRVLTVNFGNVTNSNTDNNTPESIAITYRAVVLNADIVNDGTTHDNTAVVSWTAGGTTQNLTVNAGDVTVSEPQLALDVQVLDSNGNPAENVRGNPGDTVTVRVTVSSNGGDAFESDAFDLAFANSIPAGMTFVPGSITSVSGVTPTSSGFSGGQVNVTYDSFADGSTSVFTFQVKLDGSVTAGNITNRGELTYTSIAGTAAGTLTPHNPLAGERTGDTSNTGGTANDLRETNTASVTLNQPPDTDDTIDRVAPETTIQITGLAGSDTDGGTVTDYQITALPAVGTLYLGDPNNGGTAVKAGDTIPVAQIGNLFYTAPTGFSGTTFKYAAIDNEGAVDSTPATVTIEPNLPPNLPPETNNVERTIVPGDTNPLTGLSGSDPDGSIAYYTITSIPSGGILYLGNPSDGIPVKSGDILTPDRISQLIFQSGSNFTGTGFTYTATDNLGLTDSTPATVTISTATTSNPEPTPEPEPTPNPTPEPDPEPTPSDNKNTTPDLSSPEPCQDCCPPAPTIAGLEIAPPQPILGTDIAPPIEPDTSRFSRTHSSDDDDDIRGQDDRDEIWGNRGNDTITGNEGDDFLAGDSRDLDDAEFSGDDRLYGGGGNDELNGNEKSDTVSGGNGDDIAYGGKDDDLVSGDLGNDILGGDLGDDTLLGSLGRFAGVGSAEERDRLFGNRGRDLLKGGEGEDDIRAGKDDDLAYGGKDNDKIYGELGNDTLTGDEGDDIVRGGTEDPTNPDTEGRDSIDGADGNDILFGNEKEDILRGGNGDDLLHGGKDGDLMSGDMGNDTLYGERGNDTLIGSLGRFAGVGSQEERDLLCGNDGNDILKGGEGEDSIYAGKDDDLVYAGKDNDIVFGDWGNDTLVGDQGNDTISGGNGNPDDPEDPTGRDLIFGGDGDDLMDGNLGNDSLVSGSGNDTAMGGRGDDIAWGEAGNDMLFGDLGNDTLCGNDGDDTLVGSNGNPGNTGDGNDRLNGGSGNDRLYGNEGDDILNGGDGEDTLLGGKQNDTLKGGEGNDFLAGEQGSDRLIGGGGSDVFELTTGGVDTIADFQVGVDRLVFSGGFTPEQLTLTRVNHSTVINFGTERLAILEGVGIDRLSDLI